MAAITDDQIKEVIQPHLQNGETLKYWAFGVKQPNIFLIIFLIALAILPGVIAIILLTKNYLIGLTDKGFVVLQVKGGKMEVKQAIRYNLDELGKMKVETSTGAVFTHIRVDDPAKPFVAKFHRAFSKNNREHAMAIGEAISSAAG